jgi:RNA polymerase sigma factor (sigma-70 family)
MAMSQLSKVIKHLRGIVDQQEAQHTSNGRLLELFITQRDETAFEELMRRHGPMVWGVCQRVIPNSHDAEDAFQATFLVLVRKAGSVRPREMVGNWLYGVAYRTALEARKTVVNRRVKERQVIDMPRRETEKETWEELRAVLDQELTRLPDKYRAVLVLCDLEGKTRKKVAQQLNLPDGTVASRLASARRMLAKRLSRRGFMISGGALAAKLTQNASASVPPLVMSSTIKAVSLFGAGQLATPGVISVKVAALTEGVLKAMLVTKLKITTAVLVAAATVAIAAGVGLSQDSAAPKTTDKTGTRDSHDPSQLKRPAPTINRQELDKLFHDLEKSPPDMRIELLKQALQAYRNYAEMLEKERRNQAPMARAKWEYKAISRTAIEQIGFAERGLADSLADGLNKLGSDGWELVAVDPGKAGHEGSYYVFKRRAATNIQANAGN